METINKATSDEVKIENLQQEKEHLQQENLQLKNENTQLKEMLQVFKDQLILSRHRLFGKSSEQMPEQINMFNEAESESKPNTPEPTYEEVVVRKRKKPDVARESLREDLPIEVVEHHLPEDKQVCSCCNNPLKEMGANIRREVKVIPAKVVVVEHHDIVYNCPTCQKEGTSAIIEKAPIPNALIPKSMASASVVAHIIIQKFMMGAPLYRQEMQWEQMGVNFSRQTMSNWLLTISNTFLTPLWKRMKEKLLEQDVLFADETELQVLKEPGRAANTKSYMWMYCSGKGGHPIILYEYQTTRAAKHPKAFLSGFTGYLHADGYSGYHDIPDITVVGCLAHARRKFDEALKVVPAKDRTRETAAFIGMEYCGRLFQLEEQFQEFDADQKKDARLIQSLPVLNEFHEWLRKIKPQVLPKSPLGTAVTYTLNQWVYLKNFLLDGRLEISNNRAERHIKPFVIGRKNWLFSNTPRGAKSSAMIYSLVETARENGLKVFQYIEWLLTRIPNINIADKADLDVLLPWSEHVPDDFKMS